MSQPETGEAVVEWTHWRTKDSSYLRGDEWYVFDNDSDLITTIRAYFAAEWGPNLKKAKFPNLIMRAEAIRLNPQIDWLFQHRNIGHTQKAHLRQSDGNLFLHEFGHPCQAHLAFRGYGKE